MSTLQGSSPFNYLQAPKPIQNLVELYVYGVLT